MATAPLADNRDAVEAVWSLGTSLTHDRFHLVTCLSFLLFLLPQFPYYVIPDRFAMYVYGSMFYALYFVVSFPMFLRMDEEVDECWSLSRATIDGFAASMMITQALDLWRIWIGPIVDLDAARAAAIAATPAHLNVEPPSKDNGVPFVY